MKTRTGIIALVPLLSGCGFAIGAGVQGGVEEVYYEEAAYASHGGVVYDVEHGRHVNYRRLPVPRGHLPSPGRCRIWLPGVPPGHQQRAGSCRSLERRVPAGGWLLVRPRGAPGIVEVIHYEARRPGVRARYVYDVRSKRRVRGY
jgi:hypothetical protein